MNFKLISAAAAALMMLAATPAMAGWAGGAAGVDAKGTIYLFSVQSNGRGGAAPGALALCKENRMRECSQPFGIYDDCLIMVGGILPNGHVATFTGIDSTAARAACAKAGAKCSPKEMEVCSPDVSDSRGDQVQ